MTTKQSSISTWFDARACTYDAAYLRPSSILQYEKVRRCEIVRDVIRYRKPRSILDVGCGTAYVLRRIAHQVINGCAIGIDVSPGMLAVARAQQTRNYLTVAADGARQPFSDGTFDFVYALGVLDYVYDLEHFLAELRRVLDVNGVAIVTQPNRLCIARAVRNVVRYHWKGNQRVARGNAWHPDTVRSLACKVGLRPLAWHYITYGSEMLKGSWSVAASRFAERWMPMAARPVMAWSIVWLLGPAMNEGDAAASRMSERAKYSEWSRALQ